MIPTLLIIIILLKFKIHEKEKEFDAKIDVYDLIILLTAFLGIVFAIVLQVKAISNSLF